MRTVTRALVMAALLAVFAQAAWAQTADEIAEKYLTAIGGRVALAKLKTRHVTGTVTLSTPGGNVPGSIEVFNQVPNKSRTVMTLDLSGLGMGQATIDQRFDGESGHTLDSLQGNSELSGNLLDNLKNGFFPSPFLNYKERGEILEFVRKEKVGDRDAFVLLLKPKSGSVLQCFVDVESYFLVKVIVVVNVPRFGGDLQQTTEFLDYRNQDGIKIPFQFKSSSSIQAISINVAKAEHNIQLDETMFSKPAGNYRE